MPWSGGGGPWQNRTTTHEIAGMHYSICSHSDVVGGSWHETLPLEPVSALQKEAKKSFGPHCLRLKPGLPVQALAPAASSLPASKRGCLKSKQQQQLKRHRQKNLPAGRLPVLHQFYMPSPARALNLCACQHGVTLPCISCIVRLA